MSRRPATTTANNNTTNNSPCKFSLVRTNSPMAPFLPLLSLSLLVLCNATGQNEQQQQQQQMTVQQQTTVLHLCQQFPDLDICQPVGSMEKRKSAYMRFGKRKSAYMRFGKRATGEEADLGTLWDDNDDQEQAAMAALEKRKSAYMRLGKRKSAYMRFGRK